MYTLILRTYADSQQKHKAILQALYGNSVDWVATGYRLTVRGSNPGGGRDFPHLGLTQPPVQWVHCLSRG